MNPWRLPAVRRFARGIALLVLLFTGETTLDAQFGTLKVQQPTTQIHQMMMGVQLNGQVASDFATILQDKDHYCATEKQIADWRLKRPAQRHTNWKGDDYYALDGIAGMSVRLDSTLQILYLQAPAASFIRSLMEADDRQAVAIDATEPGMFFNHNFEFDSAGTKNAVSGSLETGMFSGLGVVTSRMTARDLLQSMHWTRLDSKFSRDYPDRMATLAIGDSISAVNPWALQVYYGGVRWASKFSTQPSFLSVALPSANGQVTVPSIVDIYVNNNRVSQQQVDPGPFSIQNVPVLSGQGDLRMVVTDALGHQQVVSQPYIKSATLLRKGVKEYTYETGTMRYGFGMQHTGYTSSFAAGTGRYGWSNSLTLNGRAEVLGNSQTIGAGMDYGLIRLGALSGGVALSHGKQGAGALGYAQFDHQSGPFDFSGNVIVANSTFRQLGLLATERPPRLTAQSTVSQRLGKSLSVAIGYLRREGRTHIGMRDDPSMVDISGISSTLNWRITKKVSVISSINYSPGSTNQTTASLNLIIPIGSRNLAMVSSQIDKGSRTATLDYSHELPAGPGVGYRFRADAADNRGFDAGLYAQNNLGSYLAETSDGPSGPSWRLSETGSLAYFHRKLIPTRWLSDSFAVVEVPQAGIKVFTNNQYSGTIGRRGFLMLPSITPYSPNAIRLDDQSVPIDLSINLEERHVVPMPRSGVYVKFAAAKSSGALLILTTEDGKPVPLGALAFANGSESSDMVALHGEVFVQKITLPGRVNVEWPNGQCDALVPAPPNEEPLPRIGPLVCRKAK